MAKRCIAAWDYVPVLVARPVEEWSGPRHPVEFTDEEIEQLRVVQDMVRAAQRKVSEKFGYAPPMRTFRMIADGG